MTQRKWVFVVLAMGLDCIALPVISDTAASITVNAFQNDGVTAARNSQGTLQLIGSGHIAKFADQFISGLPEGFTGVLDISSTTPFAALSGCS